MKNKPRLVIYSDCPFFGGCESMIANFINDQDLHKNYKLTFLYRYSTAYKEVLYRRAPDAKRYSRGINLPDQQIVHQYFKKCIPVRYLRIVISFPFILLWKYIYIIYCIFPLYREIKTIGNVRILHVNNGGYPAAYSCYSILIASFFLRIDKIIYVVNNLATNYKNPLRWVDYLIDRIVVNKVDYFVTGSQHAGRVLIKTLSLDEKQAKVIHNGITMRDTTLQPQNFKVIYNITEDRLLFSVIALLEKRKGHIYLLQAITSLKDILEKSGHTLPMFVFEGVGEEERAIKDYIANFGLDKDVFLIGSINNVFNLITASDAIILPSISDEDFPNIILEAMMLGKPVIGTRVAGIPEQIVDQITGLIISPRNPFELSKALLKLMDEDLRIKFSKEAQNRFFNNFTVRRSIDQFIKLYN